MNIYEKIFARLEEIHMSQIELSRRTGIATSTISDWRKKKINPQADKLVAICKALDMSLVDLLCDDEDKKNKILAPDYIAEENIFIEKFIASSDDVKRRVLSYYECIVTSQSGIGKDSGRNISIIKDTDGNSIVLINDILFKSRRSIDWDEIEQILRKFIGEYYEIAETAEKVYIGSDFPDEFTHSKYTKAIKGANEKAKANAITAIGELIQIADNKAEYPDYDRRHGNKAKNGWYRYDTRFGIPVYSEIGEIERYNIFRARMLVRCDENHKLFLYDIVQIKKETSTPHE
ncbi:MAG: helix-turn-helix transcriptional regulator [Lachnospiraceae bacterium]|nr:helix-turn-helix transcriptional regulator [Candidatus Colinaster scatohippi]